MSHIVSIQTQIRNPDAIKLACERLQLPPPKHQTVELFSGPATGWCVDLPAWHYPVVCDIRSGKLHFDNYEERWGEQKELDGFLQAYAVERAKIEARRNGHSVAEMALADGSIKLTIQVGGGVA